MTEPTLIKAKTEIAGDEIIFHGDDGCGIIAVQAGDVIQNPDGVYVTPGTSFRLIQAAEDQLPGRDEEKRANAEAYDVFSLTCIPFGETSYLYECTPTGIKYIGPCGMPSPCGYPCTS
jgi:hypothetical protein